MAQIYNLGGLKIQRVSTTRIEILKDISGNFAILETIYNIEDEGKSPFEQKGVHSFNWRNVQTIVTKAGRTINAENIDEGLPTFREGWLATETYNEFEVVEYNGLYYQVPAETATITPSTNPPGDASGNAQFGWTRYYSTEIYSEILDSGE